MAAAIDADHDANVRLLEELVRVNSGTMNLQGVTQVGAMLTPRFEALGFSVRWIPMAKAARAGHLIAEHKGSGRGKRLLLIGHLDTVFEPDSPFQGWKRTGDIVEGPGVGDMKGGDVIMLAALKAMQAAGTLKDADIVVVLTGDEEKPGSPLSVVRADLIDAGRRSDVALDFEGLQRRRRPRHRLDRPALLHLVDDHARRRSPVTPPASASPTAGAGRSTSWRGSSTRSAASCRRPT
jgi:glutamate carboxypeptidase